MEATTNQTPLSLSASPVISKTALTEFSLFLKLPPELRAMVWRFAMDVDFSSEPFTMKTYSDAFGERRAPPKTASIDQESRRETLAVFRRLEIHKEEWWKGKDRNFTRIHNPTRFVFWKKTDVLALDWWCMTTKIDDVINYYTFQALVDQDTNTISCVEILDIDTQFRERLRARDKAKIMEIMEKFLRHFPKLREVRLSRWPWHHSYREEYALVTLFNDTFRKIARETKGYSTPWVSIVIRKKSDPRRLLK